MNLARLRSRRFVLVAACLPLLLIATTGCLANGTGLIGTPGAPTETGSSRLPSLLQQLQGSGGAGPRSLRHPAEPGARRPGRRRQGHRPDEFRHTDNNSHADGYEHGRRRVHARARSRDANASAPQPARHFDIAARHTNASASYAYANPGNEHPHADHCATHRNANGHADGNPDSLHVPHRGQLLRDATARGWLVDSYAIGNRKSEIGNRDTEGNSCAPPPSEGG